MDPEQVLPAEWLKSCFESDSRPDAWVSIGRRRSDVPGNALYSSLIRRRMTQQTEPAEPELDFDDRQRQVYPASSQADPGNDIHTGSPGLLKAPTRGPASLAQLLTARGV